jgi:crotonobetainyl-CoA:carnitine CoA-transferase CaiB-like acyl-CoA transferase
VTRDHAAVEPERPPDAAQDLPLAGIRVLDLSRFIAGPLCAQILGDLGAEVIKVERPGGEDARFQGPTIQGEAIYALVYNRNKLGITLDTRHPAAAPILRRLVAVSDVLVENYRPGTLEAMGLGQEARSALNPRLIVTSLSGFGQTGPLAGRTLFDPIAQAMSGLMSLTGDPDGPPTLVGTYIADHVAALYGAIGTLAAIRARDVAGFGQVVDIASLDALFSCLAIPAASAAMLGIPGERRGARDPYAAPAAVFHAADGHAFIHAGTDALFPRLCAAIGRPDLAADPRFADVRGRRANAAEIEGEVGEWIATRSLAEIGRVLETAGIPFGPVAAIEDSAESEQLTAREMLVGIDHPTLGPLTLPGSPIKLERTPASVRRPPPIAGADNELVFRELVGLSPTELDELRGSGAI